MADTDDVNITEVRRWAKTEGMDVPARGSLKQEVIDAYLKRAAVEDDTVDDDDTDVVTSDATDTPADHADTSSITDEATTTIDAADDAPVDDADRDDEELTRYKLAWGLPEDMTGEDVERLAATRNRVSVQTLENGFIHYQRHAGTDEVQARLAARGFYRGTASGHASEDTVQAYARFQDSIGLPGTGIPERTSLEALGFDVME